MTEQVDTPGRRGDQIKEMDLKLHPELREPLLEICNDPSTTVVVLSGSDRIVLDDVLHANLTTYYFIAIRYLLLIFFFFFSFLVQNFGEFDMLLAAENGMFLRHTKGEWMTTMPEHLNMEWVDSVKVFRLHFLFLSNIVVVSVLNSLC